MLRYMRHVVSIAVFAISAPTSSYVPYLDPVHNMNLTHGASMSGIAYTTCPHTQSGVPASVMPWIAGSECKGKQNVLQAQPRTGLKIDGPSGRDAFFRLLNLTKRGRTSSCITARLVSAKEWETRKAPLGPDIEQVKARQCISALQRFAWASSRVAKFAAVLLLHVSMAAAGAHAAELQPVGLVRLPWEQLKEQVEPGTGNCATCIGVVDETLGSCNSVANCLSSFDDRPIFFVAPWEFPGELLAASTQLKEELRKAGATVQEDANRYIHATFRDNDGVMDDVEFLFSDPSSDATVCIRSASRAVDYGDYGRNRQRLDALRQALRWEEVPILRNRIRKLLFIESPWDTFGPEPPPTFKYKDALDFVP